MGQSSCSDFEKSISCQEIYEAIPPRNVLGWPNVFRVQVQWSCHFSTNLDLLCSNWPLEQFGKGGTKLEPKCKLLMGIVTRINAPLELMCVS